MNAIILTAVWGVVMMYTGVLTRKKGTHVALAVAGILLLLVSNWLDLPARHAAADLVITGEGRFDATSLGGKGPGSLVRAAREQGKAAHVFAGSVGVDDAAVHAITPAGLPLAEALPRTAEFLAAAIARAL